MERNSISEIHLDTVDSTNTYAKTHGLAFAKDRITCIIAEEQTAARGQFQRKWIAPRGVNLYATFYFHLPAKTKNLESLAQLMALSLKKVLQTEGLEIAMKWPNDVLLAGKKVAGVLCETIFHPQFIEIIIGVGLNVNMEAEDLMLIDQPATSLKQETGRIWDKKDLLKKLQKQFVSDLEEFKKIFNAK